MILAKGKLYGEEEREVLLARLEDEINETLSARRCAQKR